MNPLIKWPGGKSSEINKIEAYIPNYKRYIEPFFGGGAMFFFLTPPRALINDISTSLIEYYKLIKAQDKILYDLLICYNNSFSNLIKICEENFSEIHYFYILTKNNIYDKKQLEQAIIKFIDDLADKLYDGFTEKLLLDTTHFARQLKTMAVDKIIRTKKNNEKKAFSYKDLKNNLITGFASGYYMYFRDVYNDLNLNRLNYPPIQYKAANFYFIREYCYGSMFRYNNQGEFNIPYGGKSYNRKNLKNKIDNMFNKDVERIFSNTDIFCSDFEDFLENIKLTNQDFMFIDPPYDTDFSDYEGRKFTKLDQERLANLLKRTSAQFILIIKNTDFIYNLYKNSFQIISFDNRYTYNVRSRNERNVEHLIITNVPIKQ